MCSVETNKYMFKIFHRSVATTVKPLFQYSDEEPPNGGVECRWGRRKSRFSADICLHRVLSAVQPPNVIHTAAPNRGKLVTLVAGKRRRLLFTGDDDEVFMPQEASINVTKTTEQHLIVRSGKSKAQNNKILR